MDIQKDKVVTQILVDMHAIPVKNALIRVVPAMPMAVNVRAVMLRKLILHILFAINLVINARVHINMILLTIRMLNPAPGHVNAMV